MDPPSLRPQSECRILLILWISLTPYCLLAWEDILLVKGCVIRSIWSAIFIYTFFLLVYCLSSYPESDRQDTSGTTPSPQNSSQHKVDTQQLVVDWMNELSHQLIWEVSLASLSPFYRWRTEAYRGELVYSRPQGRNGVGLLALCPFHCSFGLLGPEQRDSSTWEEGQGQREIRKAWPEARWEVLGILEWMSE